MQWGCLLIRYSIEELLEFVQELSYTETVAAAERDLKLTELRMRSRNKIEAELASVYHRNLLTFLEFLRTMNLPENVTSSSREGYRLLMLKFIDWNDLPPSLLDMAKQALGET